MKDFIKAATIRTHEDGTEEVIRYINPDDMTIEQLRKYAATEIMGWAYQHYRKGVHYFHASKWEMWLPDKDCPQNRMVLNEACGDYGWLIYRSDLGVGCEYDSGSSKERKGEEISVWDSEGNELLACLRLAVKVHMWRKDARCR